MRTFKALSALLTYPTAELQEAVPAIREALAEGVLPAAAVSTTQLIAFTLTSAVAGNLLALGGASELAAARWLILGIAALTFIGIVTALLVTATPRKSSN